MKLMRRKESGKAGSENLNDVEAWVGPCWSWAELSREIIGPPRRTSHLVPGSSQKRLARRRRKKFPFFFPSALNNHAIAAVHNGVADGRGPFIRAF